ncbi:MAG: S1 family peptidase [Silvanigrellaceae bacterium]
MLISLRFLRQVVAFGGVLIVGAGCVKRSYNSDPYIVGGELVEENDPIYKSAVSLDYDGSPVCTGFVYDKRTIVTAAHCLAAGPLRGATLTVTFGSKNRQLKESVQVPAKQVLANGSWDRGDISRKDIDPMPQFPKSDIGIIVLSEDVPDWVKPLPIKEIGTVETGRDVILAGFGQTRELPQNASTTEFKGFLRKTRVKLSVINDAGKELLWQSPEDNSRASSCHGDSGGPMYFVENDGSLTVIGVTSRSYSAALDCMQKGVYTDVRKYVDWIKASREKLLSGVVSTADWQHRYFNSKEGTKIALDYKLAQVGPEYISKEVWLNVYDPKFTGQEAISATLSSYINSLTQQKLKMEYAGDHRFTIKFDKFNQEKVCAIASRWGVNQDVVVEINGSNLKDSVSGEDKFKFKFCE